MSTPFGEFLRPEGFVGPRGLRAISRESSAVVEAVRLVGQSRVSRRSRRALPYAGAHNRAAVEPVLLVPGFMAGDVTLAAMSRHLRTNGFRTYRAHIRVNMGCSREAAERLERRLESLVQRRGRKVSIVGHSLGGMLARALAARRPDLVAGIVAMGSPVLAPGAVHQALAWDAEMLVRLTRAGFGGLMSEDCVSGDCARLAHEECLAPLPDAFGFTAIYSRRDGIVDWRACLDPAARQVEVSTSHCGMAIDPLVMEQVLTALREQCAVREAARPRPAEVAGIAAVPGPSGARTAGARPARVPTGEKVLASAGEAPAGAGAALRAVRR